MSSLRDRLYNSSLVQDDGTLPLVEFELLKHTVLKNKLDPINNELTELMKVIYLCLHDLTRLKMTQPW